MKAQFVYETLDFERGRDPKETMNIGKRTLIKKWFDSVDVSPDEYTIDKDLNITVKKSLYLRDTQITKLPDNLTIGGWLHLQGTLLTKLPENLTVGGSLDLMGTSISELPDNLTIGGWLDLRDTSITKLPDSLSVGGEIHKDF